ncbi:MAG TPA: Gfo/Idh/MocA family oxidoreductase [archaeon]|nr:Gfo/Idh/MocA family oxidoreductase [archaeon]
MQKKNSLTRREFLGKTTLLASAATMAAGAKKARAQLNNAAVPPPSRVGVGCIGLGVRGTELLQGSQKIFGVDLVAGCDLYKGHLNRSLELTEGKFVTTGDYQEILARQDIDAVVIATPDHWHKRMVLDALQAGKHVYIEKPLTYRWEESEELIRAADKAKKVVQVGSNWLSVGCAEKAIEIVRSGKLGQITYIKGRDHRFGSLGAWYYPIPPDASPETIDWKKFIGDSKWYDFDPKRFFQWRLFWAYSGGLATDLFVHLVSATHHVMGVQEAESVACFGDIYFWKNYRDVPDQLCAIIKYKEGFTLNLTATLANAHPGPALTFYGTEGTLEYGGGWLKHYYEPRQESFGYATNSWATKTVEQFKQIMNLDDKLQPLTNPPPKAADPIEYRSTREGSTTAHLRNFYDAIRTGTQAVEDMRFGANAATVAHMTNISNNAGKIARWNPKTKKVEV